MAYDISVLHNVFGILLRSGGLNYSRCQKNLFKLLCFVLLSIIAFLDFKNLVFSLCSVYKRVVTI